MEKQEKKGFAHFLRILVIVGCGAYIYMAFTGNKMLFHTAEIIEQVLSGDEKIVASEYELPDTMITEEGQINKRLKQLCKQYPEFEEVYKKRKDYPTKLLMSLCNNPEMIDFVKGYGEKGEKQEAKFKKSERKQAIPLLLQWDKRWGYNKFGDNNIGLSGCAPTCLSMVIYGLTKNEDATPNRVAEYITKKGYYLEGTGTSWSVMTEGVREWGITGQELGLDENAVKQQLESGHPIICSMAPGDFTTKGHFIVLAGWENGKVRVNDPNSTNRSAKLWDFEGISNQIKNMWYFQK